MDAISRAGLRNSRLQSRIFFLWICPRTAAFAALCRNIQREICSHLARFQMLTRFLGCELLVVNVYSQTGEKFPIGSEDYPRSPSLAVVDSMQLVVSGGLMIPFSLAPSAFLWDHGVGSALCNMAEPRFYHTLVYVESEHVVFAFGGMQLDYTCLASCEKFSFATNSWTQLAQMRWGSVRPLVTQYSDSLYVSGGTTDMRIEQFDLRSSEWTPVSHASIQFRDSSFLLADKDSLLVLAEPNGERFEFSSRTWRSTPPLNAHFVRGEASIVVHGLAFLLTENEFCICVDLASGLRKQELEFEVKGLRESAETTADVCG